MSDQVALAVAEVLKLGIQALFAQMLLAGKTQEEIEQIMMHELDEFKKRDPADLQQF